MQIEVTAIILVKKVFVVIRNVVRIVPASRRGRSLHYVTVFLSSYTDSLPKVFTVVLINLAKCA